MQTDDRVLGGLRCRIVMEDTLSGSPRAGSGAATNTAPSPGIASASPSPRIAVVLCHGYGAPGDDLVSLASEVTQVAPHLGARLAFVFPEAPLALSALGPWESRAWWPLDEKVLDAAITRGAPIETVRAAPSELPQLRETMRLLLTDLEREEGIPVSHVVLGGFSQGAMLATDVALHLPVPPAGLCVFSGSLLDSDEWTELAPILRGVPVLISHGRQDPLLSFFAAERLRDLLANAGARVEFVPFDGPHTISSEGFAAFIAFLGRILDHGSLER